MDGGTIGEIRGFAGTFAPRSWAFCEGQLLSINQNQALFAILGTIYGGDGRTTFALPDLRGRTMIGSGTGPGLRSYREGAKAGIERYKLTTSQLPAHSHTVGTGSLPVTGTATGSILVNNTDSETEEPSGMVLGKADGTTIYASTANAELAAGSVKINPAGLSVNMTGGNTGSTGGAQYVENMMPFTAIYYIICLQGAFPSRS